MYTKATCGFSVLLISAHLSNLVATLSNLGMYLVFFFYISFKEYSFYLFFFNIFKRRIIRLKQKLKVKNKYKICMPLFFQLLKILFTHLNYIMIYCLFLLVFNRFLLIIKHFVKTKKKK